MIYRLSVAFIATLVGIIFWLVLSMVFGMLLSVIEPIAMKHFPDVWMQWKNGPIAQLKGFIDSWYVIVLFFGVTYYLYVSSQRKEPMWGYYP